MTRWFPVRGYKGLYEVSAVGNVRSVAHRVRSKNGSTRITKATKRKLVTTKTGYLRVRLCKNNKYKYWFVHRLVLLSFVGKPPKANSQVNHKDGVKSNNNLHNLEWVSPQQNSLHAVRTLGILLTRGEKVGSARLTEKEVQEIRGLQGKLLQREIAEMFGVHVMTVNDILKGRTW